MSNSHAKNIIWLKFTINYSLFKFNYNWQHCSAISLTVMCLYQKSVSKVYRTCLQRLSHARPAPFPFPLFLFPGKTSLLPWDVQPQCNHENCKVIYKNYIFSGRKWLGTQMYYSDNMFTFSFLAFFGPCKTWT